MEHNIVVSSRDFQRVAENQELDLVEGSTPSEAEEKPTSSISIRRARKVGAPATRDSFSPLLEKREKNEENLWMMVITWTNWNLIRELLRTSWP
jgi:hypothetical protein